MTISKWNVDPMHSSIDFSVKHMMIAKVKGTFHTFDAQIEANPEDLTTAIIKFSIDAASIDTKNSDRDGHLKSADFFEIEKFPQIIFESTSVSNKGNGDYAITGNVSLHGETHSETFSASFEGTGKDPWGNEKVGFSAAGVIKRSVYGLTYNAVLETGGLLIGDEIKFSIDLEALKQA